MDYDWATSLHAIISRGKSHIKKENLTDKGFEKLYVDLLPIKR